jgi:hypothetical protein
MGLYEMKKATGFCQKCNVKLMIPSWLRCTKCEEKPVVEHVVKIKPKKVFPNREKFMGYSHTLKFKTLVNTETLIYDEDTKKVIGFK